MTILILVISIIVNLIIESTIISYIPILGYYPNTSLVIITIVALLKGKYYGAFFGLSLGIIQDILFGRVVGVNALIYFILGYIIGLIKNALNIENIAIPIIFTSLGTIFYNFLYSLMIFFLSMDITTDIIIKKVFSLEILYNGILSIFIYRLFSKFFGSPSLEFRRR